MGAECDGSGCSVSGKVEATWENLRGFTGDGSRIPLDIVAQVFDASEVHIDISDSSVLWPNSGYVNVKLLSAATGGVVSMQSFPWSRSGGTVVFADPSAVNAWVQANSSGTDSVEYDFASFIPSEQTTGLNTLSAVTTYDGVAEAAASTSWRGVIGDPCIYARGPSSSEHTQLVPGPGPCW